MESCPLGNVLLVGVALSVIVTLNVMVPTEPGVPETAPVDGSTESPVPDKPVALIL